MRWWRNGLRGEHSRHREPQVQKPEMEQACLRTLAFLLFCKWRDRGQQWDKNRRKGGQLRHSLISHRTDFRFLLWVTWDVIRWFEQRRVTGSDLRCKRLILAPVLKSVQDKVRSHETMWGDISYHVRDSVKENMAWAMAIAGLVMKSGQIYVDMWFSCISLGQWGKVELIHLSAWLMRLVAVGWQLWGFFFFFWKADHFILSLPLDYHFFII